MGWVQRWAIVRIQLLNNMWALLAGLALAAIGTGLQSAGAAKSRNAMEQRTQDELNRQAQIQRKAEAEYAQSLARSGSGVADASIQQGTEQRQEGYSQLQSLPLDTGAQPVAGPKQAVTLRDVAQMQLANKSRAKLGGYETWMLDQAIKNVRANQNLGILGQQAVRSQNILPLELQDASHAGDALSGAGMGVGALGALVGGLGALSGASAGAGAGAGTAAGTAGSAGSVGTAYPVAGLGWMGGI